MIEGINSDFSDSDDQEKWVSSSFDGLESSFYAELGVTFELGIHVRPKLFDYSVFPLLFLLDEICVDDSSVPLRPFLSLFNQR